VADFQLGFGLDAKTGKPGSEPLTVESGDVTTHGVIVGMTGSGKTGRGIVLIEEALQSGIPAVILDPKGDMGNLLLTFPRARAGGLRPLGERGRRAERRPLGRRVRGDGGRGLEGGPRGPGARASAIETVATRPEATDVRVAKLALVWVPTA
jgi:DNA helicase HerA-like ATPase